MNMVMSGLACSETSETSTGLAFFSLTFGILIGFGIDFYLDEQNLKRFEESLREKMILLL